MIKIPLTKGQHLKLGSISKVDQMAPEEWAAKHVVVAIDKRFSEIKPKQKKYIRPQILNSLNPKQRKRITDAIDDGRIERAEKDLVEMFRAQIEEAKRIKSATTSESPEGT